MRALTDKSPVGGAEGRRSQPWLMRRRVLFVLAVGLLLIGYLLLVRGAMSWMAQVYGVLAASTQIAPLLVYGLVFAGGLASALSPCYMPVLALFAGYVGGYGHRGEAGGRCLALPFIVGNIVTLAAAGAIAALLGRAVVQLFTGYELARWIPGVIGLAMGLQLLGLVRIPMPAMPLSRWARRPGTTWGAFLLGLPFGAVVTPCTIPIFVAVVTFVALQASMMSGALLMVAYALGRGVILVAVAGFAGLLTGLNVARTSRYVERASSVILVAVSLGLLLWYEPFIRLTTRWMMLAR